MENKEMSIMDTAIQQLEKRKHFIAEQSDQMTALFTNRVNTAFNSAAQELEAKHKELMEQSKEMLQTINVNIKTEEPTDMQTGI